MPDSRQTLADLISDQFDVSEDVASDLLNDAPLMAVLPTEEASDGTTHKYSKKVSAPTVGFRDVNLGRFLSKSGKVLVTAALKLLDWTFSVDVAVAKANRKKGEMEHVEEEGLEHLAESIAAYERQTLNGQVEGDASGHEGLLDAATLANSDSEMVVDATGTTAGGATSVFAIRVGRGGIKAVHKGGDTPFEVGATTVVQTDDGTGKSYPAYYTPGLAWLGLQIGSKFAAGRICNLTAQSGKRLTDDLISQLIAKFPAGQKPTHLVMNRDAQQQLQASRTATNPTGAPAPFPESAFGIPIITTDSISSTQALAVPA